jgi:hypothetical protein
VGDPANVSASAAALAADLLAMTGDKA